MSDPFVPLQPQGADQGAPGAVDPRKAPAAGFEAFACRSSASSETAILSGLQDGAEGGSDKTHPTGSPHPDAGSVELKLRKEGEQIKFIEVHCSCGKVIEIRCRYDTRP